MVQQILRHATEFCGAPPVLRHEEEGCGFILTVFFSSCQINSICSFASLQNLFLSRPSHCICMCIYTHHILKTHKKVITFFALVFLSIIFFKTLLFIPLSAVFLLKRVVMADLACVLPRTWRATNKRGKQGKFVVPIKKPITHVNILLMSHPPPNANPLPLKKRKIGSVLFRDPIPKTNQQIIIPNLERVVEAVAHIRKRYACSSCDRKFLS